MDPPYEGIRCYGHSLVGYAENVQDTLRKLNLFYLLEMYKNLGKGNDYFNSYFDKLAGSDKLRNQILQGMTEEEIRQTWQKDIQAFKEIRKKYLLYPDFE